MAAKPIYSLIAVVGIAAASAGAWWWQHRPATDFAATQRTAAYPVVARDAPASATGTAALNSGTNGNAADSAPVVEVAPVERTRLVDQAQAVGSLRSRQSVMLRPEVGGRITQINFRDGEKVKKGRLLVQFDDQLPRAQLQQARAELSIAEANHKRNRDLVAQNFISRSALDQSAANLEIARAKLALAQATTERLRIVAPFDGIAGLRNVNVGDYLKDGADIVNLEDSAALYVDFRLPERFAAKVRVGQPVRVATDVLPGREFDARVIAIDPLIDANGRSIALRGCIDNRAQQLRPGMFVRVALVFGERDAALVVPEEAIVPQGGRQFVIRVRGAPEGEQSAERVEVAVGLREPGRVEIVDGLAEGDSVVTAGQQRVQRDGMRVRVVSTGLVDAAQRSDAAPQRTGSTHAGDAAAQAPQQTSPSAKAGRQSTLAGPNPCATVAKPAPARAQPTPVKAG